MSRPRLQRSIEVLEQPVARITSSPTVVEHAEKRRRVGEAQHTFATTRKRNVISRTYASKLRCLQLNEVFLPLVKPQRSCFVILNVCVWGGGGCLKMVVLSTSGKGYLWMEEPHSDQGAVKHSMLLCSFPSSNKLSQDIPELVSLFSSNIN